MDLGRLLTLGLRVFQVRPVSQPNQVNVSMLNHLIAVATVAHTFPPLFWVIGFWLSDLYSRVSTNHNAPNSQSDCLGIFMIIWLAALGFLPWLLYNSELPVTWTYKSIARTSELLYSALMNAQAVLNAQCSMLTSQVYKHDQIRRSTSSKT